MLRADNITLHYGSSQILHGVSVAAKLGEITCIMGSNGVGKTSLLRVLSGTHACSGGTYQLGGKDVTNSRADLLAKSGVAYVPQGRLIFPMLTV
ncbi:MAG: ATP-binding cassette domain-containing protein, partial [Candidatus Puniceispirillaceae bacterium]